MRAQRQVGLLLQPANDIDSVTTFHGGVGPVEGFGESVPLGRAGQPAELAPAYVFFASQESSYITGEVLAVTGGKPL